MKEIAFAARSIADRRVDLGDGRHAGLRARLRAGEAARDEAAPHRVGEGEAAIERGGEGADERIPGGGGVDDLDRRGAANRSPP